MKSKFLSNNIFEPRLVRRSQTDLVPNSPKNRNQQATALLEKGAYTTYHPLPSKESEYFGKRFGHDFSKVKVHHDERASIIAESLDARAFTMGDSIYFQRGQYQPTTESGRRLLAHELAHVVQQSNCRMLHTESPKVSKHTDSYEMEAEHAAKQVIAGNNIKLNQVKGAPLIQRELWIKRVPGRKPENSDERVLDYLGIPRTLYRLDRVEGDYAVIAADSSAARPENITHEIVWALAQSNKEYKRTPASLRVEIMQRKYIVQAARNQRVSAFGSLKTLVEKKPGIKYHFNNVFWEVAQFNPRIIKDKQVWDVIIHNRDGVRPSVALNDIRLNPDKYAYECRTNVEIAKFRALLAQLGDEEFDHRLGRQGVEIVFSGEEDKPVKYSLNMPTRYKVSTTELVPGDHAVWTNGIFTENFIYLGNGEYHAHPLGIIRDKSELTRHYTVDISTLQVGPFRYRWWGTEFEI